MKDYEVYFENFTDIEQEESDEEFFHRTFGKFLSAVKGYEVEYPGPYSKVFKLTEDFVQSVCIIKNISFETLRKNHESIISQYKSDKRFSESLKYLVLSRYHLFHDLMDSVANLYDDYAKWTIENSLEPKKAKRHRIDDFFEDKIN